SAPAGPTRRGTARRERDTATSAVSERRHTTRGSARQPLWHRAPSLCVLRPARTDAAIFPVGSCPVASFFAALAPTLGPPRVIGVRFLCAGEGVSDVVHERAGGPRSPPHVRLRSTLNRS